MHASIYLYSLLSVISFFWGGEKPKQGHLQCMDINYAYLYSFIVRWFNDHENFEVDFLFSSIKVLSLNT